MKKLSQKQLIIKVLRDNPNKWFMAYELRGRATPDGNHFFGHQSDRRARELAEENLIEVRHEGKYAQYRAKENKLKEVWRAPDGTIIKKVYQ